MLWKTGDSPLSAGGPPAGRAVLKRILSIDGGGIRGVIPATALVALEQQLGKPVRECFDYVAGTSTGALIAAAVAAGVPASQILEIYTSRADEIFPPPKALADVKRLSEGYMYDPANTRKVVVSVFGDAAGWTLNDCPVRILLTAKGIDTHPWYFVQDTAGNRGLTGKLSLVDCAVASACAPTYFKAYTMDVGGAPTVMVDGSVGIAGNPVYQACVEAFYYDDFSPADTRVVSLGTGYFPPGNQVPTGLLGWMQWTINALLDAPEDQQTEIVNRHFPGVLQRFDWQLPAPVDLADVSSVPALVTFANKTAAVMDWSAILA